MNEIESIQESLQRCRQNASIENELWCFTETVISDLETCKNENEELRTQLNDFLNKDNSFSHLYLEVEEENSHLKNENRSLKLKMNALKLQFQSEKMEIEKSCEMKIQNLEEQLRIIKQKFVRKEAEFFEELQIAQATSAYEFEKIEKKLKWQLSEANKHLYESNIINSKLREQLENTQNESIRSSVSNKTGTTAARNTNITEYIADSSNNTKSDSSKKSEQMSNSDPLRTYEPLQVECCSALDNKVPGKQTPPLFKGKFNSSKKMDTNKCNFRKSHGVPPLIPCSDATVKNTKKRRLYDPDDLSYLIELNPDADDY